MARRGDGAAGIDVTRHCTSLSGSRRKETASAPTIRSWPFTHHAVYQNKVENHALPGGQHGRVLLLLLPRQADLPCQTRASQSISLQWAGLTARPRHRHSCAQILRHPRDLLNNLIASTQPAPGPHRARRERDFIRKRSRPGIQASSTKSSTGRERKKQVSTIVNSKKLVQREREHENATGPEEALRCHSATSHRRRGQADSRRPATTLALTSR